MPAIESLALGALLQFMAAASRLGLLEGLLLALLTSLVLYLALMLWRRAT